VQVRLLTEEDLDWPLGTLSGGGSPSYRIGPNGMLVGIDPFPAYPADLALVEDLVGRCVEVAPMPEGAHELSIFSHEFASRTNAMTMEQHLYSRADGSDWRDEIVDEDGGASRRLAGQANVIALSAKRIPIMPAMLRYLVPHEYGHAVFNYVARLTGFSYAHGKLEAEYLRIRCVEPSKSKRWHALASELVANDFRVLVMGAEAEFWPHDALRPKPGDPIAEWWNRAIALAGGTRCVS
jgi:hypothetical protein